MNITDEMVNAARKHLPSTALSSMIRRAVAAALAAVPADGETEWEYGFTSKWGVQKRRSEAGAVMDADLLRGSIGAARELGDLEYHGKVVRRLVSRTGPWLPIPESEEQR